MDLPKRGFSEEPYLPVPAEKAGLQQLLQVRRQGRPAQGHLAEGADPGEGQLLPRLQGRLKAYCLLSHVRSSSSALSQLLNISSGSSAVQRRSRSKVSDARLPSDRVAVSRSTWT